MIEQDLVEVGTRDLIRAVGLRTKAVLEIKFHAVVAAGAVHFAAEFFHEPGPGEFLVEAESGESLHAEGEEGFANVEARKLVALEHDHAATGAREKGGRHAAGWSAADNRYVERVAAHSVQRSKVRGEAKLGGSRAPSRDVLLWLRRHFAGIERGALDPPTALSVNETSPGQLRIP